MAETPPVDGGAATEAEKWLDRIGGLCAPIWNNGEDPESQLELVEIVMGGLLLWFGQDERITINHLPRDRSSSGGRKKAKMTDDRWRSAGAGNRIRGLQGRVRRWIGTGSSWDLGRPWRTCNEAGRRRPVPSVPVHRAGRTGGPSPAWGKDALIFGSIQAYFWSTHIGAGSVTGWFCWPGTNDDSGAFFCGKAQAEPDS